MASASSSLHITVPIFVIHMIPIDHSTAASGEPPTGGWVYRVWLVGVAALSRAVRDP